MTHDYDYDCYYESSKLTIDCPTNRPETSVVLVL